MMLRITEYMRQALKNDKVVPFHGSILIWNLTHFCNLSCQHCYASAGLERDEEISLDKIQDLIPELKQNGVHFVILSGGEPLLRKDIYVIARLLQEAGIRTYLSTNGLLINEKNIEKIKSHFNYLGISIDGTPEIHDSFRGKKGAFQKSMQAIRLGLQVGMRVGLRFTLAPQTYHCLPTIFELAQKENIPKIYISHLVYAGRGSQLTDLDRKRYCQTVKMIMNKAFEYVENNTPIDIVTGNNETDAVILWQAFQQKYPEYAPNLYQKLLNWGGNQAGARLLNIDARGNVKPDPFFPDPIGNINERRFSDIWSDHSMLLRLREHPRHLEGPCQTCAYLPICNGNSRVRAYTVRGSFWDSDPACYLSAWDAG